MAGNPLFPSSPPVPLVGVTENSALTQNNDGSSALVGLGRNGDLLSSAVHGQFFNAVQRGNVFSAAGNDFTGRTILAAGGTTSGFMIYNPTGSGVNMEILELLLAPLTATDVVGVIGLEYGAPPTTVTNAATVRSQFVGGRALTAQGKASYGSTIVAMTFYKWLPIFIQTTGGVLQGSSVLYQPKGSVVLAPGGAINVVSSTTQSTNLWAQSAVWAEWPV